MYLAVMLCQSSQVSDGEFSYFCVQDPQSTTHVFYIGILWALLQECYAVLFYGCCVALRCVMGVALLFGIIFVSILFETQNIRILHFDINKCFIHMKC